MVNHKKDSLDDQRSLFNAGTKAKNYPKGMNRSIVVLMEKLLSSFVASESSPFVVKIRNQCK
jgi:hypothetical protein